MPLDPELATIFDQLAKLRIPPLTSMSPDELRAGGPLVDPAEAAEAIPLAEVDDLSVAGGDGPVAARRYSALPTRAVGTTVPTVVWFHGGGWVLGDLDGCDLLCRSLARDTGAVILSVDYRLAPEHPFPAGLDDAVAATSWAAANADSLGGLGGPLVVGGDSAGANLAAVVARLARDQGGPEIAAQVLVYPPTDMVGRYPSAVANGAGPVLTAEDGEWFARHYLGPGAEALIADPRVSPLLADDLSDLPPAVVAVAELDMLHDQGVAYARALQAAGNRVVLEDFPGLMHAFTGFITVSRTAAAATTTVARDLVALLAEGQ